MRGPLLPLLLVVTITACAGGSQVPSERPSPRTLPTSVTNGADCMPADVEGLPSRAGCLTGTVGDSDGDGSRDTFFVYALTGSDRRPRRWFVALETTGGIRSTHLFAGNDFTYPRVIGTTDVDGDGRDELFIKAFDLAGHGTNWQSLELLVARSGRLHPVTFEGQPLPLRVGGPSRTGEGVGCSDGRIELLRASARSRDNTLWDYSVRRFEIAGTRARFIDRTEGDLTIADYNDPALDKYYSLDCAGLRYPDL